MNPEPTPSRVFPRPGLVLLISGVLGFWVGAIGLSALMLVTALFGAGCYRSGGFLLGLAPAIHPSLAVWVGLVMALAFAWDVRRLTVEFRPALKYFLAGGVITAISLAVQLA